MTRASKVASFRVVDRGWDGVLELDLHEDGYVHLLCTDSRLQLAPRDRVGSFHYYESESLARDVASTMRRCQPDDRYAREYAPDGAFGVLEWPFEGLSQRFPLDAPPSGEVSHVVRRLRQMVETCGRHAMSALEIRAEGGSGRFSKWSEPPITLTVASVGSNSIYVDPSDGIHVGFSISGNGERWDPDCRCDCKNRDLWEEINLNPGTALHFFPTGLEIPVPDEYEVRGALRLNARCPTVPGSGAQRWMEMFLGLPMFTIDVE